MIVDVAPYKSPTDRPIGYQIMERKKDHDTRGVSVPQKTILGEFTREG